MGGAVWRSARSQDRCGRLVERIPIAETRNYVQRVMENLQVYGTRLGASVATVEPNLHRAAKIDLHLKPAWIDATP